jgi:hypothetical protein
MVGANAGPGRDVEVIGAACKRGPCRGFGLKSGGVVARGPSEETSAWAGGCAGQMPLLTCSDRCAIMVASGLAKDGASLWHCGCARPCGCAAKIAGKLGIFCSVVRGTFSTLAGHWPRMPCRFQ